MSPKAVVKVGKMEARALGALIEARRRGGSDFCYIPFGTIASYGKMDRKHVRRAVRGLARKGLATFSRGLCSEDGEFRGSGYAITDAGVEAWSQIAATPTTLGEE